MYFSHRNDAERSARMVMTKGVLVFEYTDDSGKARKKSFKPKGKGAAALSGAWLNALRMATRAGFTVGRQTKGPVRWMVFHDLPYSGQQPFAVDQNFVWLADSGPTLLRRIERGRGAESVIQLGKGVAVRGLQCDADGVLWALLEAFAKKGRGVPKWKVPAKGAFAYNLVRIIDAECELVTSTPFADAKDVLNSLGMSRDGLMLGPHAEGAALCDPAGQVVETYSVGSTGTTSPYPTGALSPNGNFIALTAPDRHVRVINRSKGTEKLIGPIRDVMRINVSDKGVAHIFGFGSADWGIYQAKAKKLTKISASIHAEPTPDGKSVLQIEEGLARLLPAGSAKATAKARLPMLIGREGRAIFWDKDTAIVRMRSATPLFELDLKQFTR